jgi:hypothetical protein
MDFLELVNELGGIYKVRATDKNKVATIIENVKGILTPKIKRVQTVNGVVDEYSATFRTNAVLDFNNNRLELIDGDNEYIMSIDRSHNDNTKSIAVSKLNHSRYLLAQVKK